MAERPGIRRGYHVTTEFGRYMVFLAAFVAGFIIMLMSLFLYLSVYMGSGWIRSFRGWLGYTVIDSGTAWQWTFNILLWGLPALPVCRVILGWMTGFPPVWWRMMIGYVALGLTVYAFGLVAYSTDIDRQVLRVSGLLVVLTAGYIFLRRWIVVR
ncbi:hypothetical protein J5J10_06845 [Ciceribacter sp. L1K23]|uniref:hypothetical protein n=1 Tax=Ciceribacter sp. L1K23 TaxID=2820276 RepID=UPI001B8174B0|nr:hypothetical protein [Ciceribacter sp. L1K23]MBR0555395.1 hypothetical protein [Ciceribacter sp. L1K23]